MGFCMCVSARFCFNNNKKEKKKGGSFGQPIDAKRGRRDTVKPIFGPSFASFHFLVLVLVLVWTLCDQQFWFNCFFPLPFILFTPLSKLQIQSKENKSMTVPILFSLIWLTDTSENNNNNNTQIMWNFAFAGCCFYFLGVAFLLVNGFSE